MEDHVEVLRRTVFGRAARRSRRAAPAAAACGADFLGAGCENDRAELIEHDHPVLRDVIVRIAGREPVDRKFEDVREPEIGIEHPHDRNRRDRRRDLLDQRIALHGRITDEGGIGVIELPGHPADLAGNRSGAGGAYPWHRADT